ncbi:MerR family transcriptional regulator [Metabacillus malikii]|uniref:MerR family transcriptional activator of bmr protein n=1 Tax=Metabacillus malikii TaxID=1504265 RepID=A0ABT9ZGP0_9BACI|nr:MerR family transcriptional regulator [Metabacillus malikii]MDQ0231064.1 MerR family transcriptional activator of bmr gene [Metabacillus malikii]
MEETLYTIGEVAELANTSIQTLRYYDKIGLFKPAYTDPNTNYRYYRDSQLYHLDVIKSLKYIGTSLEDIKNAQQLKTDDLLQFLNTQEEIIEKRLQKLLDIQHAVRSIKERLNKQLSSPNFGEVTIRSEDEMKIIQVEAKQLTPKKILNASYRELKKVVELAPGVMNSSYGAVIPFKSYKHEEEIFYTHIYMPITNTNHISLHSNNIQLGTIPSGNYACISDWFTPEKYFATLQKLLSYIKQNQINVIGSIYDNFIPIHYSPIEQEEYMVEMKIRICD